MGLLKGPGRLGGKDIGGLDQEAEGTTQPLKSTRNAYAFNLSVHLDVTETMTPYAAF